jgi:hypothetical protein
MRCHRQRISSVLDPSWRKEVAEKRYDMTVNDSFLYKSFWQRVFTQPGRVEDGRGSLGPMANAPFPSHQSTILRVRASLTDSSRPWGARSNRIARAARPSLPGFPDRQTFSDSVGMSQRCLPEAEVAAVLHSITRSAGFLALTNGASPLICVAGPKIIRLRWLLE